MTDTRAAADADLFAGYDTGGFFDEVFADGGVPREHYEALVGLMGTLSADSLLQRERKRDALFRTQGITFTVYGEDSGVERTFPMDLVPRIIPADEWATVEAG